MSTIAELATVCATAQAQARALGVRLQRRPLDRELVAELDEFLRCDAPGAVDAREQLLAADPRTLEAEMHSALAQLRRAD